MLLLTDMPSVLNTSSSAPKLFFTYDNYTSSLYTSAVLEVTGHSYQSGKSSQTVSFILKNSSGSFFNQFNFKIDDLAELSKYAETNHNALKEAGQD